MVDSRNYNPLSEQEQAEIRARCKAATPGPWMVRHNPDYPRWNITTVAEDEEGRPIHIANRTHGVSNDHKSDAEFLAHARTDIARLLDDVEALYVSLGRLAQALDRAVAQIETLEKRAA